MVSGKLLVLLHHNFQLRINSYVHKNPCWLWREKILSITKVEACSHLHDWKDAQNFDRDKSSVHLIILLYKKSN